MQDAGDHVDPPLQLDFAQHRLRHRGANARQFPVEGDQRHQPGAFVIRRGQGAQIAFAVQTAQLKYGKIGFVHVEFFDLAVGEIAAKPKQ